MILNGATLYFYRQKQLKFRLQKNANPSATQGNAKIEQKLLVYAVLTFVGHSLVAILMVNSEVNNISICTDWHLCIVRCWRYGHLWRLQLTLPMGGRLGHCGDAELAAVLGKSNLSTPMDQRLRALFWKGCRQPVGNHQSYADTDSGAKAMNRIESIGFFVSKK